jgi:hypothetical protein
MEIQAAYECFKVIKRPGEEGETNMPTNMIEGVILFKRTNELKSLEKCTGCLDALLKLLATGPDGKSQVNIGHGAICWDCGYAGIPKNIEAADSQQHVKLELLEPKCSKCGSSSTNMLDCVQPDGSGFPWIEVVEKLEPEA